MTARLPSRANLVKSAHYLVAEVLRIRAGETVVIYCDTESDARLVNTVAKEVSVMKAMPVVVRMPANHDQNFEYPPPIRFLLKTADVVLELGRGSILAYTSTHREIMSAKRARFMSLVNINSDTFVSAVAGDRYEKIIY